MAKARRGSARKRRISKRGKLAPLDRAQRYTIDEAAAYLRISRATLYGKIQAELVITIKDGKLRLVPGEEIARLSATPATPALPPSHFRAGSIVPREGAAA